MIKNEKILVSPELLQLIAQIDAFNNSWQMLSHLAPEQLKALQYIATIESIGSSTRIAGSKLSDGEVEKFLLRLFLNEYLKNGPIAQGASDAKFPQIA